MFVTFEGPDGAGKSTALHAVATALRETGVAVRTTRQPGDNSIGASIREILLGGRPVEPLSELFLFLADRAQHVEEVVRPALKRGEVVLCDRYADSTVVYQGYARGLDLDRLRAMNDLATGSLNPDLTLLFSIDPEVARNRDNDRDRLDLEPLEFHRRVLEGFRSEAAREPERWVVVDAAQSPSEVASACLAAIRERLDRAKRT